MPTSSGTQTKPPCARISWFKQQGLDLQAMYPVKSEHNAMQDAWTWDAFAKYAEAARVAVSPLISNDSRTTAPR